MKFTQPRASTSSNPDEIEKLRKIISERDLCGLANDTKWDRLITSMRSKGDWTPSYRCKCIDGYISHWDAEWWYHLPFPLISVEWIDIGFLQKVNRGALSDPEYVDHSDWIEALLLDIGFDYQKSSRFYRIFGYSPKNFDLFESVDTE